jgi:DNA-binding beta-propeller fold protein YncE
VKLSRFAPLAFFGALAFSTSVLAQSVPQIPFDGDVNFLKLPDNMYLGEPSGVAVNSKKHVFVFNRGNSTGPAYGATAAQLLEFGPDGKFIREIGHNLYAWSFAHDVRIDKNDNIWVIDKGSDMIIEFNPAGRVMMVFGRKAEASDEGAHPLEHPKPPLPSVPGQFRQPTDVAWDLEGNIFISDGYINSRVAVFDKNGKWKMSFGTPGDGPGQFNTPHGIANDAQGNLYVADRGNRRIQVFDHEGKFLRQFTIPTEAPPGLMPWMGNLPNMNAPNNTMKPGAPWTVCITPGPNPVLYTSDAFPGRVYKMSLEGKLLGELGEVGRQPKQFGWIHQIACPSENELYVAEILNWRVQKLTLHPGK